MDRVQGWKASAFLRLNSFVVVGHHQDVIFILLTVLCLSLSSFTSVSVLHRVNKKPCYHSGKQGVEILYLVRLPAHLPSTQSGFELLPEIGPG
jgi:hypothetical protein